MGIFRCRAKPTSYLVISIVVVVPELLSNFDFLKAPSGTPALWSPRPLVSGNVDSSDSKIGSTRPF
jgi:hypothetical protein